MTASTIKHGKQYIYHDCFPVGYAASQATLTCRTAKTASQIVLSPIACEAL